MWISPRAPARPHLVSLLVLQLRDVLGGEKHSNTNSDTRCTSAHRTRKRARRVSDSFFKTHTIVL